MENKQCFTRKRGVMEASNPQSSQDREGHKRGTSISITWRYEMQVKMKTWDSMI